MIINHGIEVYQGWHKRVVFHGFHHVKRIGVQRSRPLALGFGDAQSPMKKYRGEPPRRSREKFLRPVPLGHRACVLGALGYGELGREGCGDFGEQRMLLDRVRQFLDAEVNGALADAMAGGVAMHAVKGAAWLTQA